MIRKKVVLLGDTTVGKTSLIRRFVENAFDDQYIATIGARVSRKVVQAEFASERISMELQIWDVLGQHGYSGVQRMSLSGASGAILVCDGTSASTLVNLATYWFPLLYEESWNIPIFIVANKEDLQGFENRAGLMADIALLHAQNYTDEMAAFEHFQNFGSSSAKTGAGVEDIFQTLAMMILAEPYRQDRINEAIMELVVETRPEDPPDTPKQILDWLMVRYLGEPGMDPHRMRELRVEIVRAGIDIQDPAAKSLRALCVLLAEREVVRMAPEQAEIRMRQGLSLIEHVLA